VIADVDLNFAENATDVTPQTLNSELPDSGQMGNLTYDPQSAQITGKYFSESTFFHVTQKICYNASIVQQEKFVYL